VATRKAPPNVARTASHPTNKLYAGELDHLTYLESPLAGAAYSSQLPPLCRCDGKPDLKDGDIS